MRYHLHIGMNKAASTSIQRFFKEANPVLNGLGYNYDPQSWHLGDKIALKYRNKPRCLNSLKRSMQDKYADNVFQNVIISSEQFWTPLLYQGTEVFGQVARAVRHIFGEAGLNFVVVLRRQDSFFESSYQWHVKAVPNFKMSFTEHIDSMNFANFEYDRALSTWENEFGEGSVKVLLFEEIKRSAPKFTGKLLESFGLAINPETDIALPRTNGGISREGIDFMINYPHEITSREAQRTLRTYVEQRYPKTVAYSLFTKRQRAEVIDRFQSANDRLIARYQLDSSLWN